MNERDLSDAALRSTGEGFSRFVPFRGGMSQKYLERNNCRAWDLPISLSWRADGHYNTVSAIMMRITNISRMKHVCNYCSVYLTCALGQITFF